MAHSAKTFELIMRCWVLDSRYNIAVDIYEEIVRIRRESRRAALATIINVRGSIPSFQSAKMLVRDDGSILGTIGGGCVEAEVWQAARQVMETERPQTLRFDLNHDPKFDTGLVCGGTLEIYIEPVLPVPHLYLFGGGHVALQVYRIARIAGFDVTVIDDREQYANRERFPEARDVYADDFEHACAQLAPGEGDYMVIASRGHKDDMRVMRWAAEMPLKYLGMIGSERKWLSIAKQLEAEGIPAEKLERVHSPVGLDIGAITPEEIAVSIVAEMIAARRQAETGIQRKRSEKKLVKG
jgi:xanthine dehydrogenase accessory factor